MKQLSIVFCIFAFALFSTTAAPTKQNDDELTFLKTINGKDFYFNIAPRRWPDAGKLCSENNMTSVVIESNEEWEELKSASYDNSQFRTAMYWTDARDSLELRQFSWNSTNTAGRPVADLGNFNRPDNLQEFIRTAWSYNAITQLVHGVILPAFIDEEFGTLCQRAGHQ